MLKLDSQTIVMIASLLAAVITWGIRLESHVDASVLRFEEHLVFVDKQLVLLRRDIERLENNQNKLHSSEYNE